MSDKVDPALTSDRAFDERARLWKVAEATVNQHTPAADGYCSDCLQWCTLTRSHVTSNGLLKSYCSNGDNKRMAVCLFHDALKSSTDDFAYQLYCRPYEGLYMERSVVPFLKHLVGMPGGKENKITQAALYHFVFMLFKRQLIVDNQWQQADWTQRTYRKAVEFCLLSGKEGLKQRKLAGLPEIKVTRTSPAEDLWKHEFVTQARLPHNDMN